MSTPTRELVRTACLAPSVNNSQPWSFRLPSADRIEVYADRSRLLTGIDRTGRELLLSCGAALHYLVCGAEAFGLTATVERFPRREEPDLLADVRLSDGELTDEGVEVLAALENRRTDRLGPAAQAAPPETVRRLADDAARWGAEVVVVREPARVGRAEQLIEGARQAQLADPQAAAEQDAWVDRSDVDGVPGRIATPSTGRRPTRFSRRADVPDPGGGQSDVLIAVCTAEDDHDSWLRAGETLSALWLSATRVGLVLTPASQVVEVDSTRTSLQRDVLGGGRLPQVVVRVGLPAVTPANPAVGHTPRRALEHVIRD
jgi:hypothetical protein